MNIYFVPEKKLQKNLSLSAIFNKTAIIFHDCTYKEYLKLITIIMEDYNIYFMIISKFFNIFIK